MEQAFAAAFAGVALLFFGQYSVLLRGERAGRLPLCLTLAALLAGAWLLLTPLGARSPYALWGARGAFLLLPAPFFFLWRSEALISGRIRAALLALAALWCAELILYGLGIPRRMLIAPALLFVCCLLDVCALRVLRAALKKSPLSEYYRKLAYQDVLTDCGSRMAYELDLKRLAEEKEGEGLRLVLFDLNDLKRINDRYGHLAGDDALINCARCIQKAFGACYRIGGDEFACVLRSSDDFSFEDMREKFFGAVRACAARAEYPFAVSLGCAKCEGSAPPDMRALCEQADKNLYEDKRRQKVAI